MTLEVTKVTNQIILVKAESQEALGNTFLRFQEHYESPKFRNKIFTEGEFRAWYSKKYGANTYADDWSGFNFPSHILDPFIKGLFNPLTEQEKEVVELFRYRTDKFYILGAQGDGPTLEHEICHGLYYTNETYKKAVDAVIAKNSVALKPVFQYVYVLGYHPAVFQDEVHAYVCENSDDLAESGIKVPKNITDDLKRIKKRFYK